MTNGPGHSRPPPPNRPGAHIGTHMFGVRCTRGCTMPKPHETLEKVGLLRSLGPKDREAFERRCQWRHAHPKEWLLEQNDIGTDIYFLTSGVVRVLITPSPDREIIHKYSDVAEQLLGQLVARIRALDQRVNEFSSMHVKNRIWSELLRRSR